MVIPEIELGEIAVQVLLAAVLVGALHPALEDGEVALDRVGVDDAANVLALAVSRRLVVDEARCGLHVHAGVIGVQRRFLGDVGLKDRDDSGGLDVVHDDGADLTGLAIDQGQHLHLVVVGALLRHAGLAADERLVYLDDAGHPVAVDAHGRKLAGAHRLAQPVRHEPSGAVGHAEGAVKLVGGEALLAGAKQVRRLKPQVQLDVGGLEHRADRHRELLLAGAAAAKAHATALDGSDPLDGAAVRAGRTSGPQQALKLGEGGGFVVEEGGGKGGHGLTP